jgi:hypothetical protein
MNTIENLVKIADKFENKSSKYVYHIKNNDFRGKYIYSLSELQDIYPDLYKKEVKKYKGRENHPEIKIDIIDAKWKDCINLSTLNPMKIFQLEELLGTPGYKTSNNAEIFQFNIKDLSDLTMCLYDDNKSPKNKDAYKKVNEKSYKETQFVPPETTKYFAECKMKNEYPLLFGNVTHLLVFGKIPINKAKILKFTSTI